MMRTNAHTTPLRDVRIAQGLGLRETARQAGIDPSYLSRIERGAARPTVDVLARLAPVLGLAGLERQLRPFAVGKEGDDRAAAHR